MSLCTTHRRAAFPIRFNNVIIMIEPVPSSEPFRKVPNGSETFGSFPNNAEAFRIVPQSSERKEGHTLTVREVARLFEAAGVARTERSITNWCQTNKMGVTRLDCYFDPNERRYFISLQSVELAIKEEQAKATKANDGSEPGGSVPKASEARVEEPPTREDDVTDDIKVLKQELFDLKITNKAKDYLIEQFQKERDHFTLERKEYIERLITANYKVGALEAKGFQLEAPNQNADKQGGS